MAELKRKTLLLTSGKQIKFFSGSVAIGKSLEEDMHLICFPASVSKLKIKLRQLFKMLTS